MWHKVRKMFMGSSPQSHDRLDDSDNSKDEGALLQRGYLKPLPATSLLNSENRQHLLQQLWENSLLPQAQYEQYFLEPLKSCISLMQRLPATSGGHHAVPGGMVDYSLKIVVFASRLSRGYMLPPGASAEEQSAQSAAWGAVIFYCALFHSLSSLRNIEGELLNGEVWHPGISVPDQPYRFRFRPTVPSGAGEGLRAMLGMRLLPGEVIRWLSKTPHALDSLLSFIRGDVENASVIFQIVKDAIQHAGGNSQEVPDELAVVASGITPVQVSEDTPGAADSLESSSSALKSSTELTSGASLSSAVNVQEQEPLSGSLTSALDESSVAPVVDTGQQEDEKAIREVMSLLGLGTAPAAREEVEQELAPRPECSEIMSGTLSDLVRCPDEGASGVSEVNPPEPSPSVADLNEDYGKQFISWLSAQIISGSISVNTRDAQLHIVGGLLFLPAPGIFFSFMKDKSYPVSLKSDVQRGFERQGLHFMQKGKGVFSCHKYEDEHKKGRYEKISGYLIRSKSIYGTRPIPDDSVFLFVSNGNRREV
ncbi:hypothetical protein ABI57_06015 [Salmonella enterica subsp. enterica serovar Veneziana]|nr:hypothetical protein ABI57_06015 [Salmonella enterica subsp. enterica serovar Veneziana]HBJ6433337.1 TraI domain-containing protein [Salmonella enterica subsp. enterica serovar Veneziana]